jgi:RNA polymerase sigma-70 factor (ECF subfamily)
MDDVGEDEFVARCSAFRRELLAHCYRMTGSVDDAQDLVQETMIRAWRARARFDERRAGLRTWMYAIASNVCLTDLAGRARRPLPAGIGQPAGDPQAELTAAPDIAWLQPFPDRGGQILDPADVAEHRGSIRLAFVAAVQILPPRQRAVLLLRDVLNFSAAEVAEMLATTPAAVNSALQRAKSSLAAAQVGVHDAAYEPADPAAGAVIARYVEAFEAADVDGLVRLLADDVILEMPPVPLWLYGPTDYGRFIARVFTMRGTDWRMLPTSANTQPALAAYCRGINGSYELHSLQVFSIDPAGVRRLTVFAELSQLGAFGLRASMED